MFIVGSGMSYHNLHGLMGATRSPQVAAQVLADSQRFDGWLAELATRSESEIETRLVEWEKAPAARDAHPREEHLLPLMVVAGAGLGETVSRPFAAKTLGAQVSATQFG